ncbi:restriction endonuclease subunit S, partial [Candidatus Roizmanbacteria bacterium CG_4_10_14_0_8_um_filter_33_9]
DLGEQKRIVKILDKIFQNITKVRSATEQKLVDLDELKKAVLKKAFTQSL